MRKQRRWRTRIKKSCDLKDRRWTVGTESCRRAVVRVKRVNKQAKAHNVDAK